MSTPQNIQDNEAAGTSGARQEKSLRALIFAFFSQPVAGPLVALVAIVIFFSMATSTFFNPRNLSLLFQQSVVVGTLALGQTLIILVAGIDLACGAIMVFGTVAIGSFAVAGNVGLGILAGLLICVTAACINGAVIARLRLPPFIVTLGMFTVLQAVARLYSSSESYPISSGLLRILGKPALTTPMVVSYGTILWVALTLLLCYVLNQTAWGVRVYAVGNNPTGARLNGIKVNRVIFSVYGLAGLFYFFAAWQALGRTPIADPSAYQLANLDAITAVVIGGSSLFGGRGGVIGTFVGALIVIVLQNGLTQAGIDSLYQQVATGILVVLAVTADQYVSRRKRS
ncbi:ABC transporter permease [Rhizobium sp. BE258]|uniref:ABC transporter permease n=1 Tax=Rhizobium sp. BE258 TaxID=2817722 RepID=UPI00286AAA5C|nr:ABC transporter permease [Rhizobium sp. BE258]